MRYSNPTNSYAKRVLAEEDAINELQMEIDDRVVQLLALHQLMAIDLRFVLAVSRINNDLERIGDQAVNIAQGALRILRHPRVKPYVDLPRMSELTEENGSQFPQRRRPPRRRARANRPRHRRSGGPLPRPDFPRIAYLHDGRFQRGLSRVRIDPRGQNLEPHRRPRHQHRRRRHLPRPGQDIRHNVVDRR